MQRKRTIADVNVFDLVALTVDIPERQLTRGQVGTVVEILTGEIFEVEFGANSADATTLTLRADQLAPLPHQLPDQTIH